MKSNELAKFCGALSIKEKEQQVGTLDSNLKEKRVHLLSLCLVGGPWTFDKAIIAFEEPSGMGDIADLKFNRVEFWVQIHNLPLLCLTEDIGTFLGKMIGEVSDVDLLTAKNIGGTFIRVRVAVSLDEPLMRSLRVDLLGSGTITTMLLRYERLLDYCFRCSKLGHSMRDCSETGDGKEGTTEAQLRLNVWLHSESPSKI
ncbi:hypothetical protein EZV62_000839 [Acer yangbiense]|uniref:CCHC-type domain-containing protein n=1 Tax=Acer yangbiense TaxID=1000413 RepID=A0A5C7ISF9_9ROSI|nr:hypothetical protein EZV62_000839 [Acer yangbiense]